MLNISTPLPREQTVSQEIARVVAVAGDDFVLRSDGAGYRAWRAASCLVTPEAGDQVIAAIAADKAWILAVLERGGAPTTLSVAGDLQLCVPSGRLTISARDGVDLSSQQAIALTAASIEARAAEASVVVDRVRTVARRIETAAHWVCLNATRCVRTVEELDQLRARAVDHAAQELMRLRGATTLLQAKVLAKIDGEQIHVG